MNKQAGGRPAKSGARRELKTFRLVPDAIQRLEHLAGERGGSTSDVLNEFLLTHALPRRLEVLPDASATQPDRVARFRIIAGGAKPVEEADPKLAHALERLRDGLGGVLAEIETLMAEQLEEAEVARAEKKKPRDAEYAEGFRAGMLEALETAYNLLQAELLIS